jgi:Uncharacterized protein conserved in bacteria
VTTKNPRGTSAADAAPRLTYIAFLRGVNLGPSRRLAMADLRTWLADLGYTNVRTHLQSGNVVLDSTDSAAEVARQLEKRIEARAGFQVNCVVRTPAQLRRVVEANPFDGVATDDAKLVVAFLSGEPDPGRFADVDFTAFEPELFHAAKTEIYLWHPNGIHKSKLTALLTDRRLGVSATARNWRTVTKMLEIAESG